jgi:hypothetical protein
MANVDYTSESCAALLWCSEEEAEALGGSVGGSGVEHAGGGAHYAMVGLGWDTSVSDAANYAVIDRARAAVERECAQAGVSLQET